MSSLYSFCQQSILKVIENKLTEIKFSKMEEKYYDISIDLEMRKYYQSISEINILILDINCESNDFSKEVKYLNTLKNDFSSFQNM